MLGLFRLIAFSIMAAIFFGTAHSENELPLNRSYHIQSLFIEQKLDNFNKSETRTWNMSYMANDEFYKLGGPMFISVTTEEYLPVNNILKGVFYDSAKEHNGYLFAIGHRYHNDHNIVEAYTTDNLKYLSARQALADMAHFIKTMKATIAGMQNSKVILFGSSYAGSLIVWLKNLYPDLVTGGWASVPPLLAKPDFYEMNELIGQAIRLSGNDSCYNAISNSIQEFENMLAKGKARELKDYLNICDSFDENNELNVAVLFAYIAQKFTTILRKKSPSLVKSTCNEILKESDEFIGFTNYLRSHVFTKNCTNISYEDDTANFRDTRAGYSYMRPWFYQCCNEFGWFATTNSKQQPFGTKLSMTFFTALCRDAYGDKFELEYIEKQIYRTNEFFGGLNPDVKNILLTYGQFIPWRAVGIQDAGKATIIPWPKSDEDYNEFKAAELKWKELVREWLQN